MNIKNILLPVFISCIGISFQQCTHSAASDHEAAEISDNISLCAVPAKAIGYGVLLPAANPEVIRLLGLPATITYLGLSAPVKSPEPTHVKNVPEGMVLIPAGNVQIGAEDGFEQELPIFWASVKSFLMDQSPVTVVEFRRFVKATNYITEAEKFGNAGVIDEATGKQWILIEGANWEYPMGKSYPKSPDNHPVTQVSWNDANAYAAWAGKRLPCEIEWEHAARNARNTRTKYSWGDAIQTDGNWNSNIWQGKFPLKNYVEDHYAYTSPVGAFGKTELGLTDMSGNVWEWVSNQKFNYAALFKASKYEQDIMPERVQRGGSFLCEPTWCHGYRVSGRSSSTEESSLFHVGFRCVKDIPYL